jgi:GTPase SAR1 family protein
MLSDTSKNKIIFLVGADGVGKTTLAQKLAEELAENNIDVSRGWSRYNNYTSKPLLALTRLIGLNYIEETDGHRVGYHDFHKSKLIAALFVLLQAFDVNIATWFKFRLRIPKNGVLICDRGPLDTLFDVMLDTGFHHLGRTRWLNIYTKLVKNKSILFYITRDLDKTLSSDKKELCYDKSLNQKRALYQEYVGILDWSRIDNNDDPGKAVKQIIRYLTGKD